MDMIAGVRQEAAAPVLGTAPFITIISSKISLLFPLF